MKNKHDILIRDKFLIDDTHSNIRGFMVLSEDGEDKFIKENMIVKNGRKAILNSVYSGTKINFSGYQLGFGSDLTDETMETLKSPNGKIIEISSCSIGDLQLTFEFKLDVPESIDQINEFSELGLFYKDSNDNNILFSRVVFPPYPFTPQHTYTITYYIYF